MLPLFNPRDIQVASLIAAIAAGATANFAAPGDNDATHLRYLLAYSIGNISVTGQAPIALEDVNGNLLIASLPWTPSHVVVLQQPMLVGIPGANGFRLHNLGGGAAQDFVGWVQFADVRVAIEPEIFRS